MQLSLKLKAGLDRSETHSLTLQIRICYTTAGAKIAKVVKGRSGRTQVGSFKERRCDADRLPLRRLLSHVLPEEQS